MALEKVSRQVIVRCRQEDLSRNNAVEQEITERTEVRQPVGISFQLEQLTAPNGDGSRRLA